MYIQKYDIKVSSKLKKNQDERLFNYRHSLHIDLINSLANVNIQAGKDAHQSNILYFTGSIETYPNVHLSLPWVAS